MLPGIYCPLQKEASAIDPGPALQDHQSVLLLLSHFHPPSSIFIHLHPFSSIAIHFYPCSSIPSYHLQVHPLLCIPSHNLFSHFHQHYGINIAIDRRVLPASSCFVPQVAYFKSFNVQPAGLGWYHFGDKLNALAMPCTTAASFYSNQFVRCENWSRNFEIKPLEL